MGIFDMFKKPTTEANPVGIEAVERTERDRALAAMITQSESDRDQEIGRLKALIGEQEEEHRKREANAKARALGTERRLDGALAKEASERIAPLVAVYVAEPTRKNAKAIGDEWRELNARCVTETGLPLSSAFFEIPFKEAKHAGEIRVDNRSIHNWNDELTGHVVAAFLDGNSIRIEDTLRAYEADLEQRTGGPADSKTCARKRERRALALRFATTRHAMKPFAEMHARHEAEDLRAATSKRVDDLRAHVAEHGVKVGVTGHFNDAPLKITNADQLAQAEADLAAAS